MGRLRFDIDVESDHPGADITDSIQQGMGNAIDEMAREIRMDALERLIAEGGNWPDVKGSFKTEKFSVDRDMLLRVSNTSEHAPYVEEGATWDEGPPAWALIEWTERNFDGAGYSTSSDVVQDVASDLGISPDLAGDILYVQEQISGDTRDGVHFMARARREQRENAADTVADQISRKL